jgi:hypothetical protein
MKRFRKQVRSGKDAVVVEASEAGLGILYGPDGISASIWLSPIEARKLSEAIRDGLVARQQFLENRRA